MIEGKTLQESAKACGVDLKTSFRWCHRFLGASALLKALSLQGIEEADETLDLFRNLFTQLKIMNTCNQVKS